MNQGQFNALKGVFVILVALSLVGAAVGAAAIQTVDEGHEKVVKYKGDSEGTLTPGEWHFINPLTQSTVNIDTRPQLYEMTKSSGEGDRANKDDSIRAITRDEEEVPVDVAVTYRVTDPVRFHEEWRDHDYAREKLIRNVVRGTVYTEVGGMNLQELPTKQGRLTLQDAIALELRSEMDGQGIELIDVEVRGVHLSDDYLDAVNERHTRQQELEAERIEAERRIVEAESQAEANEILSDSLTQEILMEQYIESIDGSDKVILATGADGTPVILDTSSGNQTAMGAP